ncbi:tRNA dimethylallyltransferase [Daejeonella rubra]|uniref:tRNA dimethylallyltransferase n=1 Tax=Daejeonella rubra TaxID=990371 RepID=A0A1G9PHE9_9SPHI|nr:tRNA (adenosine(37)-N6)-dimethylallyltransferase MiaA [Daejeonella rubra]SDL98210.1 tRNA dimethylallyltransferase [Daejeonella rubra]
MNKTLIIIAGPTAIGKTALAISLAEYFKTEIISADSRQFYREMNIGTAKPSEAELDAVKHHLINSHSVLDQFNAGDFEKESIEIINKLFLDHDQVIMAGGSGLFINAVSHGFDQLPVASVEIRVHLNKIFEEKGIEFLQEWLKKVDPVYYEEVDIFNQQRIIRALEVFESTGKVFSSLRTNIKKQRPFNIVKIGLNTDREKLYERINIRVDQMVNEGLIMEVENLKPYRHLNPLNTVGYSEIFNYLDGNSSREEAIEKIKQNTRRFAKRQITWFKKSEDIKWFKPEEVESIIHYLNSIL